VLCSDWLYPDLDIQVYRGSKLFDEGQTCARNGHMGTQIGGLYKIVPDSHRSNSVINGLRGVWFDVGDRIIINITPPRLVYLIKLLRNLEREVIDHRR
jgi:hypothetical protein